MKGIIKWFNSMPKILKIILALPFLDLVWNIYRFIKSLYKNNVLGIILSLILIFIGWAFMWIIDIITAAVKNKILWID